MTCPWTEARSSLRQLVCFLALSSLSLSLCFPLSITPSLPLLLSSLAWVPVTEALSHSLWQPLISAGPGPQAPQRGGGQGVGGGVGGGTEALMDDPLRRPWHACDTSQHHFMFTKAEAELSSLKSKEQASVFQSLSEPRPTFFKVVIYPIDLCVLTAGSVCCLTTSITQNTEYSWEYMFTCLEKTPTVCLRFLGGKKVREDKLFSDLIWRKKKTSSYTEPAY